MEKLYKIFRSEILPCTYTFIKEKIIKQLVQIQVRLPELFMKTASHLYAQMYLQ